MDWILILKRNQFTDHGNFWRKGFVKVVVQDTGGYFQCSYTGSNNKKIPFETKTDFDCIHEYMKRWY